MSDRIEFPCQQCGEYLGVPAFAVGKRVECPSCHHIAVLSVADARQSLSSPSQPASPRLHQRVSASRALKLGARLFLANISVYLVAFLIYVVVDSSGEVLRPRSQRVRTFPLSFFPWGSSAHFWGFF